MLQEFEYKGDKVVQHGPDDFSAFSFNTDGDIVELRGKTFDEVCRKLDNHADLLRLG